MEVYKRGSEEAGFCSITKEFISSLPCNIRTDFLEKISKDDKRELMECVKRGQEIPFVFAEEITLDSVYLSTRKCTWYYRVSNVMSAIFVPFDRDFKAETMSEEKKRAMGATCKQDVLDIWDRARERGTRVHAYLEDAMIPAIGSQNLSPFFREFRRTFSDLEEDLRYPALVAFEAITQIALQHNKCKLRLYAVEFPVRDDEWHIGGTIDLLLFAVINGKPGFILLDYKVTKAPFAQYIPECTLPLWKLKKWWKSSKHTQVITYTHLLQKKFPQFPVHSTYLLFLSEEYTKTELVEVPPEQEFLECLQLCQKIREDE